MDSILSANADAHRLCCCTTRDTARFQVLQCNVAAAVKIVADGGGRYIQSTHKWNTSIGGYGMYKTPPTILDLSIMS